jgi:hypothetical protein
MKDHTFRSYIWFSWLIAVVICLIICVGGAFLSYVLADKCLPANSVEVCPPALFGDSFGAVNALISAFAFAGMIVTFRLQRTELKMQREELAAQREEFSQQNETMRLQRFENTFFHMMELQQDIVNDLRFNETTRVNVVEDAPDGMNRLGKEVPINMEIKGRTLFYYAFNVAEHHISQGRDKRTFYGIGRILSELGLHAYYDYYTPTYFDHYFRHLYRILKFIDKNDWLGGEKQYEYATFLRATLSRYELVWLFYNGLTLGKNKLKPLIEKYAMLNNLRPELLTLCKENRDCLPISPNKVMEAGFSGTDFEFFLSETPNIDKYSLSAFYRENKGEGTQKLKRWENLMKKKK